MPHAIKAQGLLRSAALALLATIGVASCSLVVGSEFGAVKCEQEGAVGEPNCPSGQVCSSGSCVTCAGAEICGDGLDNDCNGLPDDGCQGAGSGGSSAGASGASGEGGASGAAGEGGASGNGGAGGSAGDGGSAAMAGSAGSAGSAGAAPITLGDACMADSDCPSGSRCWDSADIQQMGISGKVCSKPCCTSQECGDPADGALCFSTLLGGGLCLKGSDVGRPVVGQKATGSMCMSGSECRSGWCEQGRCNDSCCTDPPCQVGLAKVCVKRTIDSADGRVGFACGDPGENRPYANPFQPCNSDGQCPTRVCAMYFGGVANVNTCSKPCCSSNDCGNPKPLLTTYNGVCDYVFGQNGVVRVCTEAVDSQATAAVGASCNGNKDCRSNFCLQPSGEAAYCSDACCNDNDCGVPGLIACLPHQEQGKRVLRCQKIASGG